VKFAACARTRLFRISDPATPSGVGATRRIVADRQNNNQCFAQTMRRIQRTPPSHFFSFFPRLKFFSKKISLIRVDLFIRL